MPNRPFSYFSRGSAVLERPGVKKIILYVLAAAVLLGLLIAVLSPSDDGEPAQTQPSPAAETASEAPEATPAP